MRSIKYYLKWEKSYLKVSNIVPTMIFNIDTNIIGRVPQNKSTQSSTESPGMVWLDPGVEGQRRGGDSPWRPCRSG